MDKLRLCYDPEIPLNIVDLGLIYRVDVNEGDVEIDMTLTAQGCPSHVEIGRDVKSVELLVVAGVDDYAKARLAGHAHQAAQELSRPHSPRKRGDRPDGLVGETW